MNKGRIIFLNGVTSSGKTSIVEALQEQAELMAEDIKYSMRVDTSVMSSAECAEAIVKELCLQT